jgi:hypothetical protein
VRIDMKNLRKYILALALVLSIPALVNAEIVVKDTTSPEFVHNQGYSNEVSRIIQVKTVDPATPIPAEEKTTKLKNFGWYVRETIDPAVDRPGNFVNHNTNFHNSIDDL